MYAPTRTFCSIGIDHVLLLILRVRPLHRPRQAVASASRGKSEFDLLFAAVHRRDFDVADRAQGVDDVLDHLLGRRCAGRDADASARSQPFRLHFRSRPRRDSSARRFRRRSRAAGSSWNCWWRRRRAARRRPWRQLAHGGLAVLRRVADVARIGADDLVKRRCSASMMPRVSSTDSVVCVTYAISALPAAR